jgi:hypothetical protein
MRFMEQIWSTVWNKADTKLFVHILNSKHMYNTIREIVEKKDYVKEGWNVTIK